MSTATMEVKVDGVVYEAKDVPLTEVAPPATPAKYAMMNVINWNNGLAIIPGAESSELTYFVLLSGPAGDLRFGSVTAETKFINDVHTMGRRATFSVGGGSQNVQDITAAVNNKVGLIGSIIARIMALGYDGVTLDIEHTNIDPQKMVEFVKALRGQMDLIRPGLIIGMYTQMRQLNTVWAKIQDAKTAITWLSPMIYDAGPYSAATWKAKIKEWEPKIGKEKLLAGIAVNYPVNKGGLNPVQYGEVLDMVHTEGWGGVGVWQNTLFVEPWKQVHHTKLPVIA